MKTGSYAFLMPYIQKVCSMWNLFRQLLEKNEQFLQELLQQTSHSFKYNIFTRYWGKKQSKKKKRINSAKSGLHKFHKLIEIYLSISVYVKVPDHLLAVFKL